MGGPLPPFAPPLSWLVAFVYAVMFVVMEVVARVFFRRLSVRHRGRFPGHAPALVVANHPATWADVLVLDVALRRKLHFLAHASLFRPRARGWILRLYETLPVYHRDDTPELAACNDETFRACHRLFDRNEVVATFPEGVSRTDWRLQPLKTGAARLALGYEALAGHAGRLAVLPVGLYFRDRTAFRSEVEVVVGPRVDLGPFRLEAERDPPAAARALTQYLFGALTTLVVQLADADLEALARELAPLVLPPPGRAGAGGDSLDHARALAARLERLRDEAPDRLAELWRRTKAYRRIRTALGVPDRVLRECLPPARRWLFAFRLVVIGLLGALPALVGLALHIVPHLLTVGIAKRYAREESRVAFSRIGAGMVLFPLAYAVWGWLLWRATSLPHLAVAGLLALGAVLGLVALAYWGWLWHGLFRLRLMGLERRAPRAVARARAARAGVLVLVGDLRPEGVA